MAAKSAISGLRSAVLGAPRRVLVCVLLAVAAAAIVAAPVVGRLQPFSSDDPGSQSVAARGAIAHATGLDPYFNVVALVRTPSGAASAAGIAAVAAVAHALAADPGIGAVRSELAGGEPGMVSRDGRSTYVEGVLRYRPIGSELATARRLQTAVGRLPGVRLGGLAPFYAQGNDAARQDLITAELFAFPLLLLIALWVFRGLVAALLPLLVAGVTILVTLALLRLASELTSVSIYALNITTALGLGLAVDYSLLIVARYREEMALTGPGAAALSRTLASAGRTVAFSSLTVAGVLSSLLVFPQAFLRSIGLGGIIVSLTAGAVALLLLPAVLTLLRWRINAISLPRWRRAAHSSAMTSSGSRWYSISRLVMRRPLAIALASTALLLALASPVLGLRITQVDWNVLPTSMTARAVHDAIAREFPAAGGSAVLLAASAPAGAAGEAELQRYAAQLRALPGVAGVAQPERLAAGLERIEVAGSSAPLSSAGEALVRRIRALPAPGRVLVGGEAASLVDLRHSLGARLPLAVAIVVAITLFTVLLMTRSLVLAVKALLMSSLTIAATLGALVLVFQDGALQGFFDYTSSHALEPSTLVLIFALSFALATDYGIFLLSRIRELRERGLSDRDAVANGLERTGPVVTAAALLLCVALGSLMTGRHALVKEAGFGAALAVALDATVVRALLLPSLMCLLGRWNWWAPAPFARPLPAAGSAAPAAAERPRAPARRPSDRAPALSSETLASGRFCDHQHPSVLAALREVVERTRPADDVALAAALFEFVRDEVRYTFGPWGTCASVTLTARGGTCTNKANLLVALMRAAGIPAAYGVMRVNARRYFGVLGPPFLTRYASAESVHVYAGVLLEGRWLKCDASTDRQLAARTAHFCQQTRLIEWDGREDSLDFLDERHVYADLGLYANIDELLARPARASTPWLLATGNSYLEFIRTHPAHDSSRSLIDAYLAARPRGRSKLAPPARSAFGAHRRAAHGPRRSWGLTRG